MTRLHFVKKARKDYPDVSVLKGDSYYWWAFRYGGKYRSKAKPRRSQLTQSEFLGQIYDIEDRIAEISDDIELSELESEAQEITEELQSLAEEQEERRENMPDGLQDAPTGQLLEERADYCNEMADELEALDFDLDVDKEDYVEREEYKEAVKERKQEIILSVKDVCYNGE